MRAKEARQISIVSYLALLGIEPIREEPEGKELWYSSPLREGDKNPSFNVDTVKNLWFDYGIAEGGNTVDLVCKHQNITVKESLAVLERTELYSAKSTLPSPVVISECGLKKIFAGKKEKSAAFDVLGVNNLTEASLIRFLNHRKINLFIAQQYLKQVHYRLKGKEKSYYALGWPCGDGFEARSPFFKGFIGTKKDLIRINLKDNQTLSIFEGFMDFLAFLSFYDKKEFQSSVIILNSINLKKRVLKEVEKYRFSKVYLFLDNDIGGKKTVDFFKESIANIPLVDKSCLYEKYNDFNEMIIES